MTTWQMLATVVALIGSMMLADWATRPRSFKWYVKRYTRNINRLSVTISADFIPALTQLAAATDALQALLPKDEDL